MFHVEIDQAKNLISIRYSARVGAAEVRACAEQVAVRAAELAPGFRLLTDLSQLDNMDLACVPYIKRMMDLFNQKGVDCVVRVIPDPHKDIGLNIMSLFHYRRRVRIITCETLAEAAKVLT